MASSTTVLAVKTPTLTHKQRVCVCGFNYVRQTERGHMSTSLDTCVGKSIWVNLVVLLFVFHDFVVKQQPQQQITSVT